jgi:hypothetical protein
MRGAVEGGPADGCRVPLVRADGRWIDGERGRGFRSPAPGRALYRRRGDVWVFAGFDAGHCEGCGVFVDAPRPDNCPLCGRDIGG